MAADTVPSTCFAAGRDSCTPSSSSSSDQNIAPRVRFQPSPTHAFGSAAAGAADIVRLEEGAKVSSQRQEPPPTITATKPDDASSFVLGGTAKARRMGYFGNVTRAREPWSRPQPQRVRLEQDVGNSSVISLLGVPPAELKRRGPALPRRTLDEACEDIATPRRASVVLKGESVAQGEGATPGFAVSLPDTCDILDAEPSPPHSPTTSKPKMTIFTPPAFDVSRTRKMTAGCTVGPASFGQRSEKRRVTEASRVDRFRPDLNREGGGERAKVEGRDLDRESVTDARGQGSGQRLSPQHRVRESPSRALPVPTSKGGATGSLAAESENMLVVEGVSVDEERLGGEHHGREMEGSLANGHVRDGGMDSRSECEEDGSRLLPARGATRHVGDACSGHPPALSCGSGSEDELSDAESVLLLAVDGRQHGANAHLHQHQHDPGTTTPSRAITSPECPAGDKIECNNRSDKTAQPLAGGSSADGADDEEEEETFDEAGSFREKTSVAFDVWRGGEQSTAGLDIPGQKREGHATDGEMAGLPKGDGLARLGAPSVDVQGGSRGDNHEGFRVAGTTAQTSGLGGGVREKDEAVASLGADGNTAVPETSTQSVPMAAVLQKNAGKSVAVSVETDGSPPVPERLAQSSPVAEMPQKNWAEPLAEGREDVDAPRLRVLDSCLAHADTEGERRRCEGGAALSQLELGDEHTREVSSDAAQEAKRLERANLSQEAPLQQGLDEGVLTRLLPETHSRSDQQQETQNGGEKEPSGCRAGGRLEDNQDDEVPETLPPSVEAGGDTGAGKGGSKPTVTVCLATQEQSGQEQSARPVDAEKGAQEDDHYSRVMRKIPETQSITAQEIQSLTTQEVPETAHAWGSAGTCESTSAHLEGGARAVLTGNSSSDSDPQTKVLKKKQGGLTSVERPGGASALPGSRRTGAAGLPGAVDNEGSREDQESPGSGKRKRSADSATLSPSRSSCDPGSGGKRGGLTTTSVAGRLRPVELKAASKDVRDTSKGFPGGRSTCQKAGGGEQGPPVALRGGGGSGKSDDESEFPQVDHDLGAVQDAWHAAGGHEFGQDGGCADHIDETEASRPPSLPPPYPPPAQVEASSSIKIRRKSTATVNPYAKPAHLELHAGSGHSPPAGDATGRKLPPGTETGEGRTRLDGAAGTTVQARGPRSSTLRRPVRDCMGFSGGVPRAPSALADPSVTARLMEQRHQQSSNSILGAGRGYGREELASASAFSSEKTGSWSTYSLGPDTEAVSLLQAQIADKRAPNSPYAGIATESNPVDAINFDDDGDDLAGQGGRCQEGARGETSAKKKRSRMATAAAATSRTNRKTRHLSSLRRLDSDNSRDESPGRRLRRRRHRPVIVLLDCAATELERAKLLCKRLGLRDPFAELVPGATHVVVGSLHTKAPSCSNSSSRSGGGGNALDTNDKRGTHRRHRLVTHELNGYREAVMLGLWVLDFSWVETCLQGQEVGARNGSRGSAGGSGRESANDKRAQYDCVVSSPLVPPRDFEVLGCSENHEGCEPRRGRYRRFARAPGVFHKMVFFVIKAATASPSKFEESWSATERLLKIGEGDVFACKPSRVEEGYLEDPFGPDENSDFDAEVVAAEACDRGGSGGGGGGDDGCGNKAAAKAKAKAEGKSMVVLALSDSYSVGGGVVSAGLAKVAINKRKEFGAAAAVDRAWVDRSVEEGYPVPFKGYDLGDASSRAKSSHQSGGGPKGAASKGTLEIPRGSSSRREVVDVETEGGRRLMASPSPLPAPLPLPEHVRAERERLAMLLRKADEVLGAPLIKDLPAVEPAGLGAEGFEFTRKGSKKAPGKTNVRTYAEENKAQRDLNDALHQAGYLDLNSPDYDGEKRLGGYWFDNVYGGFYMRRSENAIPEAKRRGCPLDILRAQHESHESIQTDLSRKCLGRLPGEFSVWRAGSNANAAVELV
ncbi:unnamed protein product [Pylaiella littoralis]